LPHSSTAIDDHAGLLLQIMIPATDAVGPLRDIDGPEVGLGSQTALLDTYSACGMVRSEIRSYCAVIVLVCWIHNLV